MLRPAATKSDWFLKADEIHAQKKGFKSSQFYVLKEQMRDVSSPSLE